MQGNQDSNLNSLRQGWTSYRSQLNNIINLSNNNQSAQAAVILDGSLSRFETLDDLLVKVIDARKDFINAETRAAAAEYERTKFILIVSVIVVILISVSMAFYLSRSINSSIQYLIEIARRRKLLPKPMTNSECSQTPLPRPLSNLKVLSRA